MKIIQWKKNGVQWVPIIKDKPKPFVTGVTATLSMSIFLATSRGKYTWKQTPGQSVLIFGKIIGTHCDRRDAWPCHWWKKEGLLYIPNKSGRKYGIYGQTWQCLMKKHRPMRRQGLQLPLLCMERAGALQPPLLPFFCLWIRHPLSGHSPFWYPLFPIPFHPHFQTFHATWWHVTTTYWKSAYYSN